MGTCLRPKSNAARLIRALVSLWSLNLSSMLGVDLVMRTSDAWYARMRLTGGVAK